MERDGWLNHSWKNVLIALFVTGLMVASGRAALAQTGRDLPTGEEPADPALQSQPGVGREPASTEQTHQGEVGGKSIVAVLPPLPFQSPQIGPVIKRSFADDVDRRTTAFIPQSGTISELTPVKFPAGEERWIRVDLSEQMVVAYERRKPVRAFIISSGLPGTPTVTGEFRIRTKVEVQTMTGGVGRNYYNLPGVKWVQYFYEDYSFHGTYWHNDFGRPKSHGCLNMTNADAKWLFDWAGPEWDGETVWFPSTEDNPGTVVIVTE